MRYVQCVRAGQEISSPDPSDPLDAQQVFVDQALLRKADRLENVANPTEELPQVLFDCIDELMTRVISKCEKDIPTGTKIALLGGIQINSGEGLPDYFLAKKFQLLDSKGKLLQDLLSNLMDEGAKDPRELLKQRKAEKLMSETTPNVAPDLATQQGNNFINISIDPVAF